MTPTLTSENTTFIKTNDFNTTNKIFNNEQSNNKPILAVSSKEYQTLLDRFRRKNLTNHKDDSKMNVISNINQMENLLTEINKTLIDEYEVLDYQNTLEVDANRTYREIERKTKSEDGNPMEKLRVDDATRTKIYYDFSKTVNKVSIDNDIDETTDINFNVTVEDYLFENETELNEVRMILNDTLLYPSKNLSSSIPSFQMQTPRPGFIDGKFILNLNNDFFCLNAAQDTYSYVNIKLI